MGILTTAGRVSYQQDASEQPFHLAWGAGDPSWLSNPPAESVGATALVDELGRLEADTVAFVTPDVDGPILLPSGNTYSISVEPTRYLYVYFHFLASQEPTATIREIGVFTDTVKAVEVPGGQRYLLPVEVDDPGSLLILENLRPPITRSAGKRQEFAYILIL